MTSDDQKVSSRRMAKVIFKQSFIVFGALKQEGRQRRSFITVAAHTIFKFIRDARKENALEYSIFQGLQLFRETMPGMRIFSQPSSSYA